MIEGRFLSGEEDLADAFHIRKEVFQKEQKVDPLLEFDEWDKRAMHVIVYAAGKPVATGRILEKNGVFKIGRIAVLKEERGKKYGDFVVRMLVDRAFQAGVQEVVVGAQINAAGFYEKIGFEAYGVEYEEAGITHIAMRLKQGTLCKKCQGK